MDHEPQYSADGVEQLPLRSFTEKAYLDYSMYVILDRALPLIGDGLKPVQRRIVYAMSELGLSALEVQWGWGKGYAYDCKASCPFVRLKPAET